MHIDDRMPAQDDLSGWQEIAARFAKRGIPNIAGAIDCTHFLITEPLPPNGEVSIDHPYLDRKSLFSITAQAIVDADGCFRDFVVGFPGSIHDSMLFCYCFCSHTMSNTNVIML